MAINIPISSISEKRATELSETGQDERRKFLRISCSGHNIDLNLISAEVIKGINQCYQGGSIISSLLWPSMENVSPKELLILDCTADSNFHHQIVPTLLARLRRLGSNTDFDAQIYQELKKLNDENRTDWKAENAKRQKESAQQHHSTKA